MSDPDQKVVLVTGGAQGIGKGIVHRLLVAGWAVVIADLDREAGVETLAEYQALGRLLFVETDVADVDVSGWRKSSVREAAKLSARDHGQHPVGRVGVVEDVAALAHFLLTAEAGFITGQNYVVDGGMTRKMIYAG